jgi:hypothetical protein
MRRVTKARLTGLLLAGLALAGCTTEPGDEATVPPGTASASATVDPTPDDAAAVAAAVAPGPFRTTETSYALPDLGIPDLPVPVEVEGVVVGPVDAPGPLPLVVLMHGYSGSCWRASDGSTSADWPCPDDFEPIPSLNGFDYLQQRLASQGYLTVSVSANGVNVAPRTMGEDAGRTARSALIRHHLDAWASGEVTEAADWTVDPQSVLLVGHSRGGEGVDQAVADRPDDADWRVRGEVLIAPTGFNPAERSSVPVVALAGYCDGDVGPGLGQRYVDRPADPTLLRSAVIVDGANHNYFNTEWTPGTATVPGAGDDAVDESGTIDPMCQEGSAGRLTAAEQQEVAARILGLAAAAFLRADAGAADVLDGRVAVPTADDEVVRVSAVGRGRTTVAQGAGFSGRGVAPVQVVLCTGTSETEDPDDCGRFSGEGRSMHWPAEYRGLDAAQFVEATWTEPGGSIDLDLAEPLDLSTAAGIEARIAAEPDGAPVGVEVVLTDAAGVSAALAEVGEVPAFPDGQIIPSRRWGQRMFVPLTGATDLDLTRVTRISLMPRTAPGHVWVIDVSALPQDPPA